ncbi:MAG: hypothetical protein WC344_04725 [Bacilli bacterium]
MQYLEKTAFALAIGVLGLGLSLTAFVNNGVEGKADDQTYTYVKGDGVWITTNTERSYDAGEFSLIHRKNDSTYNIATSYAQMRIYAKHSLEIFPATESGLDITSVEVTATMSVFASVLATSTTYAGSSSTNSETVILSPSISGLVVTFDLSTIGTCAFFKFKTGDYAYISSIKINYNLLETLVYEHDFTFGDLGSNGVDNNGQNTTLADLDWKVSSSWNNQSPSYHQVYIVDRGLQIGTEGDAPSNLALRSAIPDFAITRLEFNTSTDEGGGALLSVAVGTNTLSTPQALSDGLDSDLLAFDSGVSRMGHIKISFSQSTNYPLYIKRIRIYGLSSADIASASSFARSLETFDSCGSGAGFSDLQTAYQSLGADSFDCLVIIALDDCNDIGEMPGSSIREEAVSTADKWLYVSNKFSEPSKALNIDSDAASTSIYLVCSVIIVLFGLIILVKRKAIISKKSCQSSHKNVAL